MILLMKVYTLTLLKTIILMKVDTLTFKNHDTSNESIYFRLIKYLNFVKLLYFIWNLF